MNRLNRKKWAMGLLLLAASPLVTATEEPKEEPTQKPAEAPIEEQSTFDILMNLLTPGGTSQGPP